jgi:hypothetical protein
MGGGDQPIGDASGAVYLHLIDSSGNDLFSPYYDGQNGFWIDSVIVSNIKTGTQYYPLACFNNNKDAYQFQQRAVVTMMVCSNNNIVNQYSYTLIQLKPGMTDTLKIHINQASLSSSTIMDTIWYNKVILHYDSTATLAVVR